MTVPTNVEAKADEFQLSSLAPNEAGRISVKLTSRPDPHTQIGFSLSLQEVLNYEIFRSEASKAIEASFRYQPAECDPSGAAWLRFLQARTRYPKRALREHWGKQCPGSTRTR